MATAISSGNREWSHWLLPRHAAPAGWRYAVALGITSIVVLLEALLTSATGAPAVFLALVAVMLSAWLLGRGPGLLSGAVSTAGGAYLLSQPIPETARWGNSEQVLLLAFAVSAVPIALVTARAGLLTRRLESLVEARTRETEAVNEQLREEIQRRAAVETRLREREFHYRNIVETSYAGIAQVDAEGRIQFANQRLAELLGCTSEELLGRPGAELLPPEERHLVAQRIAERRAGRYGQYETRLHRRDGEELWAAVSAGPLYDPDGEFQGVLTLFVDITERRRVEGALRDTEARFGAFMDNLPAVAVIRDEAGVYVTASRSYKTAFGKAPEELVGRTPFDVFPREAARQLLADEQEVFSDGKPRRFTQFVPGADGKTRELLTDKFLLQDEAGRRYIGSVAVDVTDQRALEEQLRQSQKMEAIGRLAGGVAHDFNNMLAVILGYSQILAWRDDIPDDAKELIHQVHTAGDRAAALTRQLLAFSRRQIVAPQVMDVSEAVSRSSSMFRRVIGEDIELVTTLVGEPVRVMADPSQVEQILWNLIVNARDAMPGGGKLTVETQAVELDEAYAALHTEVHPGAYVLLAVTDNGMGMDAATRERIFEPFFTTKAEGRGTGLGLATVFGIVKQSEGHIYVYSEPGCGTSFKLYFPRVEADGGACAVVSSKEVEHIGTGTVLLVEDEEMVRMVARDALERAGYTVLEAASGEMALAVLDHHSGPVHLVLTDVVMPSMSGRELVERLKARWPELRVLLMSGYTDDAGGRHRKHSAAPAVIQKPFTPASLARKVHEVLGAG